MEQNGQLRRQNPAARAVHPGRSVSTAAQRWIQVRRTLESLACLIDQSGRWPKENLRLLSTCGAMGWTIPHGFGGYPLPAQTLHNRYQQIAAACLTTALILTQRDAAIEFLNCCRPHPLAEKLLREAAGGRRFITIGISQITTSGQHHLPTVTAHRNAGGWSVSGVIPWATGAHHADWIVAGAAVANEPEPPAGEKGQILFLLPMRRAGVRVQPAQEMAVLNASDTASVTLSGVRIMDGEVLAGPAADVMSVRRGRGRLSLNTCILPLGVAAGALDMARELASARSKECRQAVKRLEQQWQQLNTAVCALGRDGKAVGKERAVLAVEAGGSIAGLADKSRLRARANLLCSRAAMAALELAKGRGLSMAHAAQRRARESTFFFVWSSPAAVIEETLGLLAAG